MPAGGRGKTVWPGLYGETGATSPAPRTVEDEEEEIEVTDGESDVEVLFPGGLSWLPSGVIPLIRWPPVPSAVAPLLVPSHSLFSSLSPALPSLGNGDTEVQELGLPVLGVNGGQVALGTRKPALSPVRLPLLLLLLLLFDSFLSDDLE